MKKFSIMGALLIGAIVFTMIMLTEQQVPQQLAAGVAGLGQRVFYRTPPVERYGIDLQDLYLCTDVIQPNENFSEILSRNGIPVEAIHEIVEKSQGVLDLRKIVAGKSYCIMRSMDSLEQVQYFIYEQDPIHYVVYELSDSIKVTKGAKPIETITRTAAGTIESSLWNTLEENNLNPELAIRMASIYAWSIDFFRLQKGDHFKLIYEENRVEGKPVGIGEIKAMKFHHNGDDHYAIHYVQDTVADYFDSDAKSLRKAFLKAPLEFRRVSSHFNKARFHPILKTRRPHLGTDYAAATGTPVWAIGNGTVLRAEYNRGNGNFVEIKHNGSYTTKYLHLSGFGPGMRKGASVSQGQVIGYVGSTGLATGPHLHFEMIKDGRHVDAMQEQLPPGDPIQPDCMDAYKVYRDQVMQALESIPDPVVRITQR